MAAPAVLARAAPIGEKLRDGFRTLITFELNPTIRFWEKSVTPPGIKRKGDKVDQTTFFNTQYHTYTPPPLFEIGPTALTVAYDPKMYSEIMTGTITNPQTITVTFPIAIGQQQSYIAFFGYLESFEPQEHKEGEQPEAKIVIVVTNFDRIADAEEPPIYQQV